MSKGTFWNGARGAVLVAGLALGLGGLVACGEGGSVSDTLEEAGAAVESAGEKTAEAAEAAGREAREAAEKAAAAARDATADVASGAEETEGAAE